MKKLLSILSLLLLAGCSTTSGNNSQAISNSKETDNSSISESYNTSNSEGTSSIEITNEKTLIAYFSVTSNTKTIATYIQEHLKCEIFEIVPENEYGRADINYANDECRANREQNDDTCRPAIKSKIGDISKYDTIVLGYPIWWAQAPKIMYTFIESYDFTNKTILPFCTSGSSPIGTSATNLAKSAPKANWLEGKRFAADSSKETVFSWIDENFKNKEVEKQMNLYIDNQKLDVAWEDNDSVKALKELLPVTINMHEYGGFEQTGSIGSSIVRSDVQMNVVPGDIVLYNGNAISVFYNSSSWSYTKIGHINLSDNELNKLLNKDSVTFALKGE